MSGAFDNPRSSTGTPGSRRPLDKGRAAGPRPPSLTSPRRGDKVRSMVRENNSSRREPQRLRLIFAAADTFSRIGYANASVADVIAAAGMSRRSFYEFFKSKEDILLAVVDFNDRVVIREITRRAEKVTDPVRRIETTLHTLLEMSRIGPMIGYQVMAAGEEPRARRQAMMSRICDILTGQVEEAHRRGLLGRPPDPITIRILVGGVDALALSYHQEGRSDRISEAEPLARDLFFRAFR